MRRSSSAVSTYARGGSRSLGDGVLRYTLALFVAFGIDAVGAQIPRPPLRIFDSAQVLGGELRIEVRELEAGARRRRGAPRVGAGAVGAGGSPVPRQLPLRRCR